MRQISILFLPFQIVKNRSDLHKNAFLNMRLDLLQSSVLSGRKRARSFKSGSGPDISAKPKDAGKNLSVPKIWSSKFIYYMLMDISPQDFCPLEICPFKNM